MWGRTIRQYFTDNFVDSQKNTWSRNHDPICSLGFVLLQNENRWINDIKFPRRIVSNYYKENLTVRRNKISCNVSRRLFEDKQLIEDSFLPQIYGRLKLFAAEVDKSVLKKRSKRWTNQPGWMTKILSHKWVELTSRMNENKKIGSKEVIQDAHFYVHLDRHPGAAFQYLWRVRWFS